MESDMLQCEGASPLMQAVQAWLEGQKLQPGPCLLLDFDVVELAARQHHPELVAALLEDPEQVRLAAISALAAAGLLGNWERIWLRPRQLLAAAELSVPEALQCMRAAPGALCSCHGVCVAATALFQHPASRTLQCTSCSRAWTLHGAQALPPSCCGQLPQEMMQERIMVQGQVIFLASDSASHSMPTTQLAGTTVAVRLTDDLCGRVHVGDRVLATGCGRLYGGVFNPGTQLPVTLGMQMEACNVEVLHPAVLTCSHGLPAGVQCHLEAMSAGGLESILEALNVAAPVAASPLLKLALLMSCAATGTGSTQMESAPAAAGLPGQEEDTEPEAILRRRRASIRNQVNVMLLAAAPEPHVERFLGGMVATLCDHSVRAMPGDPRALLPALDAKYTDPLLGVPAPLLVGGQLAEASAGVLLLSSSTLDPKRAIGLGQYLRAGEVVLASSCPELCVSVGATLWTMVHAQDLSRAGQGGDVSNMRLSLTERIINRFSHPFFCQHDVVMSASPDTEEEVDLMVESIMGRCMAAAGPGAAGSARQHPAPEERAQARRALQYQLEVARAQVQPVLTDEAQALLCAYYLHLRTYKDAQQGLLASLMRLAAACARLRHSLRAEALPDATLAVAFVEERLLAAGAMPLFWPRWREELQRCTELGECLRGLLDDCVGGLGLAGSRCAGQGQEEAAWAEQPEE